MREKQVKIQPFSHRIVHREAKIYVGTIPHTKNASETLFAIHYYHEANSNWREDWANNASSLSAFQITIMYALASFLPIFRLHF
jgi:hypothetical protein